MWHVRLTTAVIKTQQCIMCVLLRQVCVDVNNVINNESVVMGTQQGAVFIVALYMLQPTVRNAART